LSGQRPPICAASVLSQLNILSCGNGNTEMLACELGFEGLQKTGPLTPKLEPFSPFLEPFTLKKEPFTRFLYLGFLSSVVNTGFIEMEVFKLWKFLKKFQNTQAK
jgi:hypothetical protein